MLEELRKKPKAVRAQYAFWIAFLVTGAIAAVWLLSLSVRLDGTSTIPEEAKEHSGAFSQFYDEATANLTEIFSAIKSAPTEEEPATSSEPEAPDNSSTSSTPAEPKPSGKTIQIVTSSSSASSAKSE